MMLRFTLFGFEVATFEVWPGSIEVEEPEEPAGIGGDSGQNFERDFNPPDPMGEEFGTEFGFR